MTEEVRLTRSNSWSNARYICSRVTARAATMLGLALVASFAGPVGAEDSNFGIAAGTGGISKGFVLPEHVFTVAIGDTGFEQARAVAVDASGNIYATGWFEGTVDFDPGVGTVELTSAGGDEVYVLKLDASGRVNLFTFSPTRSKVSQAMPSRSIVNLQALFIVTPPPLSPRPPDRPRRTAWPAPVVRRGV